MPAEDEIRTRRPCGRPIAPRRPLHLGGAVLETGVEVRSIRFRKVTKVAASPFTQRIGCFPISGDQVDVLPQWLQQAKPEVEGPSRSSG